MYKLYVLYIHGAYNMQHLQATLAETSLVERHDNTYPGQVPASTYVRKCIQTFLHTKSMILMLHGRRDPDFHLKKKQVVL